MPQLVDCLAVCAQQASIKIKYIKLLRYLIKVRVWYSQGVVGYVSQGIASRLCIPSRSCR